MPCCMGVVGLAGLPDALLNNPYGGQAAVYIIDGSTGDFLMDTWHNEMGNIWDLGERPLAPGYNHAQLKQGLINGETGYVVFVSQTINRYLYFCYEPIGINNWRIALSVPEEVVFASADNIRYVLNWFLALEILLFVLYFVVMFSYNFRKVKQKQREIDTISYIYEVERPVIQRARKTGKYPHCSGKGRACYLGGKGWILAGGWTV